MSAENASSNAKLGEFTNLLLTRKLHRRYIGGVKSKGQTKMPTTYNGPWRPKKASGRLALILSQRALLKGRRNPFEVSK